MDVYLFPKIIKLYTSNIYLFLQDDHTSEFLKKKKKDKVVTQEVSVPETEKNCIEKHILQEW